MNHPYIHEWFRQTANAFADATAVDRLVSRLTYSGLDEASNNVANALLSSGATKGSLVGILAENSSDVLTAIIGTLKAGCVFVPFDPHIPESRLRTLVQEVHPQWYVMDAKFHSRIETITLGADARPKMICADRDRSADDLRDMIPLKRNGAYVSVDRPGVPSDPDDMCYLYFTSGSTGRPKAIAGRLKSIDHFIRWEINTLGIDESTRVSQLTSPSSDAYLRDVFAPLCAGGTVCIPPTVDIILDASKLIDWIDAQRINIIHCVPSLFRSILSEDLKPERFTSLKYVLLAGEPLLPSDVEKWVNVFGERIQLVNLYGPSETTMTKFYYFVKPSDKDRRTIPIGVPMEGADAFVIDEKGKACPRGMVGEIYVQTPYRTLGYYSQPQQTAEVFVPNPFRKDPNDLLYKTGDLGRVLPNGNFEFMGRKDHQVKIRGIRVELAEIENVLRAHEAVNEAVVIDREDHIGNKYLCAYVIVNRKIEQHELRDFTARYLPTTLLPSAFVVMDALPRTLSGKVDRKALPDPGHERGEAKRTLVSPRTSVEKTLVGIWEEILGISPIGVQDHFFELGGHSLLATQLVSRIRNTFRIEFPIRRVFETPTLEHLAAFILKIMIGEIESLSEDETKRLIQKGR